MAAAGLKNFKEIVQNKAYRINSNDRKIFEEGDLQSFFGLSEDDLIEFIIYDASENQLPQKGFGNIRYIPLTTENINDYFLLAEGTTMTRNNLPSEFFIDIERLIKEAGYINGIFKTQVSLLNKRLGSYKEDDKLWIGEISPSRTEIRLFPLEKSPNIKDIKERYNIFYTGGEFRTDTIINVLKMVQATTPSLIADTIKKTYGENFYNKLKTEYKIQNFDTFIESIHSKFLQSAEYEFTNRISNLKDVNYGKPKSTKPPLQLSEKTIMEILSMLIINAINAFLPAKDEQLNSLSTNVRDTSLDDARTILQTQESDIQIDAKIPEQKITYIEKPNTTDVRRNFIRQLPIESPVEGPLPPVVMPIEIEDPGTGDIIRRPGRPIEDDDFRDEPIRIEIPVSPVSSGGGGGGSIVDDRTLGTGLGREIVVDSDINLRQNIQ
jgi:hypothetical protein